ncbi:MAG: hypothetical protein M3447_01695 [Acidobacteriota bacterium]|nr:hypothetical protein [Acidobacteriota bacterium]
MISYRVVARPTGAGKIFFGDQLLAQCRYALTVRQECLPAGPETVSGFSEIDGVVTGRKTWEDIEEQKRDDEPLTLHLADGQRLNFIFVDARSGRIKGTGYFY